MKCRRFHLLVTCAAVTSSVSSAEVVYDYDVHIAPILERYCVSCHGPDQQESDLRLDSFAGVMTPGSSDEVPIVPFVPMESPLLEYLLMPKSDEYAMPPEGEEAPTADEILQIAQWIYHGARSSVNERMKLPLEQRLAPAPRAAWQRLRAKGAIIQPLSATDAGLRADLREMMPELTREDFADLASLAPMIVDLNLPRLASIPPTPAWLSAFTQLQNLNLSHSRVAEELLPMIGQLAHLHRLNLFGAQLDHESLDTLEAPQAKDIWLGGIHLSADALRDFRELHPEVEARGDPDLAATMAIHQNARHNSVTFNPGDPVIIGEQISATGIRHSLLICGKHSAIISEDNEVMWRGPDHARDGIVLPNGNILISAGNQAREYRGYTQEVIWSYPLDSRNEELGGVDRLPDGNTLLVERGILPRLLEIDGNGKIVEEVALHPETDNGHWQTRMARKLPHGNYLVAHPIAGKIKEYTPAGEVVKVIATDQPELGGRKERNWPFTAIRLPNGHTISHLTHSNKIVEFDVSGVVIWSADNRHADGLFREPSGGQRLPNGNTVIGSHGQLDPTRARIFELNGEKEVVWKLIYPLNPPHQIQVLTTNGKKLTSVYR